jgi:four helix bundle protein
MKWKTSLNDRAFEFGAAVLRLYPRLSTNPAHAHMALQLLRAASSIGAHLEESKVANSRRDMGAKQAIALREARESRHWLRMFIAGDVLVDELRPLSAESHELTAMLTASVKKLRSPAGED